MRKNKRNKKKNKKAIKRTKEDWVVVTGWKSKYKSMQNLLDHLRKERSGSESTRKNYSRSLNEFCKFHRKNPDELAKLSKKVIEKYAKEFLANYEGKYANDLMYVLKSFYKQNGITNIHFPRTYEMPRGTRTRKQYIPTLKEAWKMIMFAGNLKHQAILACLILLGFRNSTLRALLYGSVITNDLRFKHLTIKNDVKRRKKSIIFMVTPGMKRIVESACKNNIRYYGFLPEVGVKILKLYLAQRKKNYGSIKDNELLFPSEYNNICKAKRPHTPLSREQLNNIIKKAARNAGLKYWRYVTAHALRKVFKSILKNQPSNRLISEEDQVFLMGHIQSGSIDSYYDDTKIDKLRKKCEQMIYKPLDEKIKKRNTIRRVIDESELQGFLDAGWEYQNATPSGKLIMSKLATIKTNRKKPKSNKDNITTNRRQINTVDLESNTRTNEPESDGLIDDADLDEGLTYDDPSDQKTIKDFK